MEYKLLDECCEILDSQRVPITESDREPGPYPYYGANGVQDYVADYLFDDELVLLAEDGGNFGSKTRPIAYRVSGKCWVNNHAHVIKPKAGYDVDYICYSLMFYDTSDLVNGATRQKLTQAAMRKMRVPNRSIDEQLEISYILQKAKDIINQRKKQIDDLDALIKARFVEMFGTIRDNRFGYEIKTIQDVCEQITDGTHQTPEYTEDKENGYKFLSSKDVTSGKIEWSNIKYIPCHLHEELYKRIAPQKGDLLLAKNGTTGVAAIVETDDEFDIYVSLALLRPMDIAPAYLWGAINSAETKEQFDGSLKGIGVPNLHLGEIKKTKIIVPPKSKQLEYAEFIEQVDKSKVAIRKSLEETQLLFDSLMQEYFG